MALKPSFSLCEANGFFFCGEAFCNSSAGLIISDLVCFELFCLSIGFICGLFARLLKNCSPTLSSSIIYKEKINRN